MSELGREFDAYQSFLLGAKLHWTKTQYRQLRDKYDEIAQSEGDIRSVEDVERHFAGDTDYAFFGWFERHLQRMKYAGRLGLVPAHESLRPALEAWLSQPLPTGLLTLDPDLVPPKHFTSVDIHQHPGGVCGDSLAGVVYERGARSTTPLLHRDLDLHYRFARLIREYAEPSRIVDLGCGFGKSTQPICEEFPDARVVGIDVSAPCLRLAAVTAAAENILNVQYGQGLAENTTLPDGSVGLVTSTMLLHEMPPAAVTAMVNESARVLEPGGYAIHLDFLAGEEPFDRFVHYGHARRNNEPFMRPLNEMDLASVFQDAGLTAVDIQPFEERPGALADANHPEFRAWRFPWAVIIAKKAD